MAKTTALSLGNVIGANILNMTLIAGIIILLRRGIIIESKKTKADALYMFFIISLPFILMWIGHQISRIDGIILLAAFFLYVRKLYKERKVFTKEAENNIKKVNPVMNTFLFISSLVLLYFSSQFVVNYATSLSMELLLPPVLLQ
jgi:Ca2+/Na+ antiporter